MIYDIMATNADGLWTHLKFGWSIPRRNGKSEVLIMRAIYAVTHGERVLYTAHRTTTSHNAWEKIVERLTKLGYVEKEDFKTTKQMGLERIDWLTDDSDGVIQFRTRSSKGGLGEGVDLLIIDEAQEYTADQETALKYIVTDSQNPQTLMCGTPPTAVSAGTVFTDYRHLTLAGENIEAGWAEWSVPELTDAHNVDLWYETNPSLGTILNDRKIRSELGGEKEQIDDNIQRLGLWLTYNQKSAISETDWEPCRIDGRPKIDSTPEIYWGVKYAKTSANVSLSAAVKCADGKIFVETIDCRPTRDGNDWIIAYLRNPHTASIAVDGAGGQAVLADDIKNASVRKKPILPKVVEIIEANARFERDLFAGGKICHAGQPALTQVATNCEHRAIGSAGGFGYTAIIDGADISILDSVVLAYWQCATAKPKRPQTVNY